VEDKILCKEEYGERKNSQWNNIRIIAYSANNSNPVNSEL
jgi:hypothetical protein